MFHSDRRAMLYRPDLRGLRWSGSNRARALSSFIALWWLLTGQLPRGCPAHLGITTTLWLCHEGLVLTRVWKLHFLPRPAPPLSVSPAPPRKAPALVLSPEVSTLSSLFLCGWHFSTVYLQGEASQTCFTPVFSLPDLIRSQFPVLSLRKSVS